MSARAPARRRPGALARVARAARRCARRCGSRRAGERRPAARSTRSSARSATARRATARASRRRALLPRPRDFTSGKFKIRTTPSGALPTDDDLRHIIREGMPYTSMPAWRQL